ncbi:hypothetical protein CWB98_23250 [Pseudoalteromonas rubra]|uniref:Uncharacterized protein n=2 Tax=Pseudoalteromonas rubra TaxID=43658 RepID=A0A5S3WQ02_9GAMM|nr:hypothetical protein CWB98_23250 [Pseudoalteromonas rubra]
MKLFKSLLLPLLCFSSTAVFAGVCNPDFCHKVYIERLYVEASGKIFIGTSGDEKILNCNAESGSYVTIPAGTPGADFLYSALLTAQTTNLPIEVIQVDDNLPGCVVQYITLDKK